MTSEQIQSVKESIEPKLIEFLNDPKLIQIFRDHGVLENEAISIEFKFDLTKIQPSAKFPNPEAQGNFSIAPKLCIPCSTQSHTGACIQSDSQPCPP